MRLWNVYFIRGDLGNCLRENGLLERLKKMIRNIHSELDVVGSVVQCAKVA